MLMSLSLFAAAAAAPVISRRLLGDFASPPAIIVSVWGATLGLFVLRLLPYAPLDSTAWLVILGTVAGLVAGSVAAIRSGRVFGEVKPGSLPHPGAWVTVFGVIGLSGTLWYAASVIAVLGWDGFANAETLRYALFTQRIPSVFLFAQLFSVLTPILALAVVLGGTRLPRAVVALAIGCALTTLTTTDRTQFFSILLTSVFMTSHRFGRTLSWRRAGLIAMVSALLFVSSFLAIETWRLASDRGLFLRLPGMVWVPGKGAVGPAETGPLAVLGRSGQRLALMYAYATGSYAALDRLLDVPAEPAGGVHTFFPVLRLLQRAGVLTIDLPPAIPDYVELYPQPAPGLIALSFNSYTFIYYPLMDFGVVGALAYALVVGLIAGLVYAWARRDRADPLRLLVYGQVATALALTVLVNKFNNTAWWYVLVLGTAPWALSALRRAVGPAGAR